MYIFYSELSLHIIYRHPFFDCPTADRALLAFFAASAAKNVMLAGKEDHINLLFKANST